MENEFLNPVRNSFFKERATQASGSGISNGVKLTGAVYKLLEFFPEADPLKNRAKDKALAIMEGLLSLQKTEGWLSFQNEKTKAKTAEEIDALLGYLWIGKSQGWLNSSNCLIISHQYEKIKEELKPALVQRIPEPATIAPMARLGEVSDRQKKIVGYLSENEKAQVVDLQKILPDITKRTIRRDLDVLLELGKIVRMGDFNQVFYKIKADN